MDSNPYNDNLEVYSKLKNDSVNRREEIAFPYRRNLPNVEGMMEPENHTLVTTTMLIVSGKKSLMSA